MDILINLSLLAAGLVILIFGGDFLVRGATSIAYSFQLSPLVVGLTVVAFGTSAPELVVNISAAMYGKDSLALGNIVGSNICNLALVLGITALIYPIKVDEKSIKIDWVLTMGSALLLQFFVAKDYTLSRFEGIILFFILIIYTYFLIQMSRRETKEKLLEQGLDPDTVTDVKGMQLVKEIGFFLLGCAMLYVGAEFLFIKGATGIALGLFGEGDKSDRIIGLTIVAIGTSLPELVASGMAAYKKDTDMAMGNLLGSCIFNILSILGITSTISSITDRDQSIVNGDMWWMMGVILVVLPIMATRRRIARFEGFILLSIYITYITYVIINAL